MSLGSIIGGVLRSKLGGTAERRIRSGMGSAGGSGGGGLDRLLGSVVSKGAGSGRSPDIAALARDFLGGRQAGGMTGAQIGGLGALVGGVFGGGLKGAAQGGALAVLGTLALKAYREHQASQGEATALPMEEATDEEAEALTAPETEELVLQAMIGAAQADGRIDAAEMERILSRLGEGEATPEERRRVTEAAGRFVDVEALGARVTRPEVAAEVYLAALLAVEVDTEGERDYLRRLAEALRLDPAMTARLQRMTGAPEV